MLRVGRHLIWEGAAREKNATTLYPSHLPHDCFGVAGDRPRRCVSPRRFRRDTGECTREQLRKRLAVQLWVSSSRSGLRGRRGARERLFGGFCVRIWLAVRSRVSGGRRGLRGHRGARERPSGGFRVWTWLAVRPRVSGGRRGLRGRHGARQRSHRPFRRRLGVRCAIPEATGRVHEPIGRIWNVGLPHRELCGVTESASRSRV